jgi:flagellar basal-body rod modification protein FlgD
MNTVNGLGPMYAEQASSGSSASSSSTSSSSTSDVSKTEFLKLLVAQLKNQDPLNPVDNEQFITQLATFSSLEQLQSINAAVTKLAGDAK